MRTAEICQVLGCGKLATFHSFPADAVHPDEGGMQTCNEHLLEGMSHLDGQPEPPYWRVFLLGHVKKTKDEIAKIAADWWAERFQIEAKREAFREALQKVIAEYPHGRMRLIVDYDPWDKMLEAVHAADVECRGILHSAKGILPYKTRMRISFEEGSIIVNDGYGGASVDLL